MTIRVDAVVWNTAGPTRTVKASKTIPKTMRNARSKVPKFDVILTVPFITACRTLMYHPINFGDNVTKRKSFLGFQTDKTLKRALIPKSHHTPRLFYPASALKFL